MKRLALVLVIAAVGSVGVAVPASGDSAYRIPLYPCSVGIPGTNLVPANTPLFYSSGWTTGTKGLVQSAINNATITITDTRQSVTTVHYADWGPITQDNFLFAASWTANWRIDIPPLAVGETATLTTVSSSRTRRSISACQQATPIRRKGCCISTTTPPDNRSSSRQAIHLHCDRRVTLA
jgi:hypothetical protein